MYGKGQSVIVSIHCINKAFVYGNSSVNHKTFLTGGCKPTWVYILWWSREKEWISHWKFKACLSRYCLFTTILGGTYMYVQHDTDCVCESWYLEGCFDSEDRGIMVSKLLAAQPIYTQCQHPVTSLPSALTYRESLKSVIWWNHINDSQILKRKSSRS